MADTALEPFMALHRAGRFGDAEVGYRHCLRGGNAAAALPLAALLLQQRRYAEAVDVLEPRAALAPDDAAIATNLSIALRHSGRQEDALHFARRAFSASPDSASACNALGLAALELGHSEEALAAFDAGLRRVPGHVAFELHRGQCLRRLDRTSEALTAFEQVVASSPQLLEGWRCLASAQAASGRFAAALDSCTHAHRLAPDDAEVSLEHAIALLRNGRAELAVPRLKALVQRVPDDARAWTWLGRASLRNADKTAARTAFEQAIALDPADPVAAHFHASLAGVMPEGVESDYVRALFDDFADRFELTLVDRLAYVVPGALAKFLAAEGMDDAATVLDLGCGTGLMGAELTRPGRCIDGVDLSARMLAHARAKRIYRELGVVELLAFLRGSSRQWDLVVAADVFIYMADLKPLFEAVFDRLPVGGCLAFSIECSDGEHVQLLPETGRYRHSPRRVVEMLLDSGFAQIRRQSLALRIESGVPVAGELLLAKRA